MPALRIRSYPASPQLRASGLVRLTVSSVDPTMPDDESPEITWIKVGGEYRAISRICTFRGHDEYHCVGCCVEHHNEEYQSLREAVQKTERG